MNIVLISCWLFALGIFAGIARAEEADVSVTNNEVREGHRVAILICSNCHVVAHDQSFEPILRPPAPSFESIAQRTNITTNSVREFLATTHRNIGNPTGMPNPN